jgi:ATP-dependent DNA helicase PIF1
MSNPKQAQSCLRTITRDFSSSSVGTPSQSIDIDNDIEWPLTPQIVVPKVLTGQAQRLKDIEDALAGRPPQSQPSPLSNSTSQVNKRANPSSSDFAAPPAKRRLPSSWNNTETSMPSKQAIASRAQAAPKKTVTTSASSSTATTKPAKVFLSSEQTQILKLVTEGHSVFYTGSAGAFLLFLFL